MDVAIGERVRVRGLTWDVVEAEPLGAQQRLRLRCVEGDLSGLEWDILHPTEAVEPRDQALQPERPASVTAWRLHHMACLLDQLPSPTTVLATDPGQVRIEPYQLVPLMRALELPRPRLLLADGVGLGKTIEAGLIAVELIARRRAHRILVVAPAGPLLAQWEQELRVRFGLRFTRLADTATLNDERRRLELGGNVFASVALSLTSLDFAKQEPVVEELERAAWDLAIIDEAHHCVSAGTDREDTQRRRLAEVIARRSDGLLLLTATPHDGYDPHFASLIELLDPSLVDGHGGLAGSAYRRHVVRRLKAHVRDRKTGQPLFRDRKVIPVRIDTAGADGTVRKFHQALSALVVPRLRRHARVRQPGDALAFISLLKRSASTVAACVGTLRAVAARYGDSAVGEGEALRRERARTLRAYQRRAVRFGALDPAGEADVERLEVDDLAADLLTSDGTLEALRELVRLGLEAEAHDPKLMAMLTEVRLIRLAQPKANILVYTEYADSLVAAVAALRSSLTGTEILAISGKDDEAARTAAAERFADIDDAILLCTDALAEGLNLHRRCRHLIHLDLPYNPNRLEQRNGRIDRYGQKGEPEIRYLYLGGTFEERLLLRLIGKYENARGSLTFMPDTLGVTADAEAFNTGLVAGFAEHQASLFTDDASPICSLDRAAEDVDSPAYRELLHEIDRAYGGFEKVAVRHGWMPTGRFDAEVVNLATAAETRGGALLGNINLLDFTREAIAADVGGAAESKLRLVLSPEWAAGLGGLPGYDVSSRTIAVTHDRDSVSSASTVLGRAHPLVCRAITRLRRNHLDNAVDRRVSAAHGKRGQAAAVLLTYLGEIRSLGRIELRRVIAILVRKGKPSVEIANPLTWLELADPDRAIECDGLWHNGFACWVQERQPEAERCASTAMNREFQDFAAEHGWRITRQADALDLWLRGRANDLCGAALPEMDDLFGAAPTHPAWHNDVAPLDRLAMYAADVANPSARRREASRVVELYRHRLQDRSARAKLASPVLRPIGMLMLVPP